MKIKVDYKKHYGSEGCVYNQFIKINDKKLFNQFNNVASYRVKKAKKQKLLEYKDIMNLSYLKRIKVKNLNYLKLTQLYLLIELLRKNNINTERIHIRNTILKYSEF